MASNRGVKFQLLEAATSKLRLNAAARRLFLSNGEEIFRPQDIPRDAEVFISQGEPYIDSMKALRSRRFFYTRNLI